MRSWVRAPGGPSILESSSRDAEDSSIHESFSNDLPLCTHLRVSILTKNFAHVKATHFLFTLTLRREKSKQIAILKKKARLNYRYRS